MSFRGGRGGSRGGRGGFGGGFGNRSAQPQGPPDRVLGKLSFFFFFFFLLLLRLYLDYIQL